MKIINCANEAILSNFINWSCIIWGIINVRLSFVGLIGRPLSFRITACGVRVPKLCWSAVHGNNRTWATEDYLFACWSLACCDAKQKWNARWLDVILRWNRHRSDLKEVSHAWPDGDVFEQSWCSACHFNGSRLQWQPAQLMSGVKIKWIHARTNSKMSHKSVSDFCLVVFQLLCYRYSVHLYCSNIRNDIPVTYDEALHNEFLWNPNILLCFILNTKIDPPW